MTAPTGCEFVPYLSVRDGPAAVAFYRRVFDVEPRLLLDMPDGRVMHCEFRVGDGRFFVSDELPEHGGTPSPAGLGGTSVALHVYVPDCDALVRRFRAEGATVLQEPVDMFWGERFARVRDPFGHAWGITTTLHELSPDQIRRAAAQALAEAPDGEPSP